MAYTGIPGDEMKIITYDTEGNVNGWLIPIWNALEQPELRPEQIYVTAIAPHSRKGPHLHMEREGRFHCIVGEVLVFIRPRGGYPEPYKVWLSPGYGLTTVPAGSACALYNFGDTEAIVLNLPSPAWSKDNPDDHPVTDWKDPEGWPPVNVVSRRCEKCSHKDVDHDSGGCCRMSFCGCCRFEVAR